MAIKKTPQDFVVDEILTDQWREKIGNKPGPFAIYRLQKTSVTTPQALTEFSKQLGIKPGSANYAGLKDKHGVTSQHVTFDASSKRQRIPGDLAGANWTAKRLGYVDQRIDASAIEGNRFDLVIRTLTRRALDEINTQVERLTSGEQPCSLLTPNYFGNQRFGSLRSNDDFIAKHLIRGEFEQALKLAIGIADRKDDKRTKAFKRAVGENWGNWDRILSEPMRLPERAAIEHLGSNPADFRNAFAKLPYFLQQIWVDAFQSWIWNETAAGLLADRCESAAESMHVVNDMYNRLVFPSKTHIPDEMQHLSLPVLGHESQLRKPWASHAQTVLDREEITTSDLRIPGLRRPQFGEVDRPLFVEATDFHVGNPQPDELQPKARRFKCNISFTLPRGAYATVLLRGIAQ